MNDERNLNKCSLQRYSCYFMRLIEDDQGVVMLYVYAEAAEVSIKASIDQMLVNRLENIE